jgi:hypothetical protein
MKDLDDALAVAFTDLAEHAPHDPDLAGTVRRRVRRRRRALAGAAALAAGAALVVTGETLLRDNGGPSLSASAPPVTVRPACDSAVTRGVLPQWARGGFSDPEPVMPYVRSTSGNVVAILFGYPLTSPPRKDVANKVLWVWHRWPAGPAQDVHMTARLGGTGPAFTRGLPPPVGPSYVDLPSPGCWRVTITWPGGSDTIDLTVVPAAQASPSSGA